MSSPFGPGKRISSPAAEADAAELDAAELDGDPDVGEEAALVAGAFDAALVAEVVLLSSPHAASNTPAAVAPTPSSPSRRNASRRESRPSSQSRAIS